MNRSRENLPVTISADWHSPIISATIYLRVAGRGSIIADVIRQRTAMKFSVKSALVAVVVFSAFFAGWVLPPPFPKAPLSPVLVANREIAQYARLSAPDFRVELMPKSTIPSYAAREINQITNHISLLRVRTDGFVFIDELEPPDTLVTIKIPLGHKVVAIALPHGFNPFALNLLSTNDVVSLHGKLDEKTKCIIPRCSVFTIVNDRVPKVIGLLLDDSAADSVVEHQDLGFQFFIDIPDA